MNQNDNFLGDSLPPRYVPCTTYRPLQVTYTSHACPYHMFLERSCPMAWPSASLLQLSHVKYSSSNGKGMQHLLSVVYTMTDAHLCTNGWIEIKDWRKDATQL